MDPNFNLLDLGRNFPFMLALHSLFLSEIEYIITREAPNALPLHFSICPIIQEKLCTIYAQYANHAFTYLILVAIGIVVRAIHEPVNAYMIFLVRE